MGDQSYLHMARNSGAQGLGFDIEPPPPAKSESADSSSASSGSVIRGRSKQNNRSASGQAGGGGSNPEMDEFVDDTDVKYETVKDEGMGRDQTGLIRAATLERLVERLTHEKISDPKFRRAFLLTYRSFTTPLQLIEALVIRYDPTALTKTEVITTRRVRVVGVMKAWMEDHFFDFAEGELQQALQSFLEKMEMTMSGSAKQLRRVFEKSQEKWAEQQKAIRSNEEANESSEDDQAANILKTQGWEKLPTKQIAEQMTLLESQIYCAILPKECISWNKKDKETLAPNISQMIHQFNRFSGWVTAQMVQKVYKKDRIDLLKRFIDLMEELQTMNNFNGMMEVLSGINSSSVRRLKKTFAELDADYSKRFEKIEELLAHKLSYKVYREHLHQINPPCVPYMGVYLTDLTFMSDGNPDTVDGGLINFKKRRLIAEVIDEIQQYQVRYLKLQQVPSLKKWLLNLETLDEDVAYKWSRRVEPKDDEAIIAEFIKSEESLLKQIAEYEAKAAQLEKEIEREEAKKEAAG